MCRNGKATRRQNALHHLGGTDSGDAIAVATRALVVHPCQQIADGLTGGGRVKDRQQMKATLHRDFHTGEEVQLTEPVRWRARAGLTLHICIGQLEPVDPLTGVVVGDRHAVDFGGHVLEQPCLRR